MTLEEVEAEVTRLYAVWGFTKPYRFLRERHDMGAPHIEGDVEPFDWVVTERGQELERRRISAEDLIYETLRDTARSIALRAELNSRSDDYSRGTWMEGQARLLALLGPGWAARLAAEQSKILAKHPLTESELRGARRLDLGAYGAGQ